MRDNDYRRHQQARDFDDERYGRDADNWGSQRQQGGYQGRDQGGYSQPSQSDYNRWGGQGRSNDYGSDYGSSRFGGAGSSGYGGYGGGNRYQDDRSAYGRQQEQFSQGAGQQGYNDRFSDEYGSRQYGEPYGRGEDRYSQGFYGDASRFSGGRQDTNRSSGSQTHHDPDYHQWRSEQLRNLDKDYDDWRNERYQKFSEDFNSYRAKRSTQNTDGTKQQTGGASGKAKDPS